jgi:hypothetical protein
LTNFETAPVEKRQVGPIPRWTVGTHWLAYDRDTGRLYGSD